MIAEETFCFRSPPWLMLGKKRGIYSPLWSGLAKTK